MNIGEMETNPKRVELFGIGITPTTVRDPKNSRV